MLRFLIKNARRSSIITILMNILKWEPFRRRCRISDKFFSLCAKANRLLFRYISSRLPSSSLAPFCSRVVHHTWAFLALLFHRFSFSSLNLRVNPQSLNLVRMSRRQGLSTETPVFIPTTGHHSRADFPDVRKMAGNWTSYLSVTEH